MLSKKDQRFMSKQKKMQPLRVAFLNGGCGEIRTLGSLHYGRFQVC